MLTAHPRLGPLALALVGDPSSTKVWAQGAEGERAVAASLGTLEDAMVLHDRLLRRPDGRLSRANIDHIAVVPTGVWVIDAKSHKGRLEVRRSGGLFTPRVAELRIGGRDQTKLIDGLHRQVEAVRAAMQEVMPEVPVRGALCFYGTEMPWIDQDIDGIPLRGRRGLTKLLRRTGPVDHETRETAYRRLNEWFPAA
ncbi:nuclease-related domain-containing protein [uncultured Amnibacterium sp.]|uniref:nuclease-related domain-containing protein n=1 Tax=uncultured Amnibacterium sp. TaxID=1631851 RepID=UPI0035CB3192